MRSGLLLFMVAAMIPAGCRSVYHQTADSAAVESAALSSEGKELSTALASFLQGRLIEEEHGQGSAMALPYYTDAAKWAPGSHTVYSRIAIEGMHRGDLDASIEALEKSIAAKPDSPERLMDLGAMYQLSFRLDDAAAAFEQALVLQPTNTPLYITLSDIRFAYGEDEKAIELLEEGYTNVEDPEPISTYLQQQVRRFITRDELPRAIQALTLLAQSTDDSAEMEFMIGQIYMTKREYANAMQAFTRSIEDPRAPVAAYLRLVALYLDDDATKEAMQILRKGQEAYPKHISFPAALGGLYYEKQEFEEALLAYEKAIQLLESQEYPQEHDGDHSEKNLLIAKGAAQERLQKYERAAETMHTVLDQYPDSHIAMNFLAYMWAELDKKLDEAYALSQRSLEKDPENGAYLDTLGWIYYRKGEYERALEYLRKAQDQLGPDPEILLHIGDVHAAKDDKERAKAYWKKSLQEDPTPRNRAWEQLNNAGIDPEKWLDSEEDHSKDHEDLQDPSDTPEPPNEENEDVPKDDSPDESDEQESSRSANKTGESD